MLDNHEWDLREKCPVAIVLDEEDEVEDDDYVDEDNQGMDEETEELVDGDEEEDTEQENFDEQDLIVVTTENIFEMKENW